MSINSWLEDELYQQYLRDSASVDESWKPLFDSRREPANGDRTAPASAPAAAPAPAPSGTLVPLRGASARVAQNMSASLSMPLATSQRTIPVKVIVVANDITYKIGSFGPAEDQFFYLVTQYARARGIPRIYLSANSGARIGLAEEVLPLFSAAWSDKDAPHKGIKYLYLTPENYIKVQEKGTDAVRVKEIEDEGEEEAAGALTKAGAG